MASACDVLPEFSETLNVHKVLVGQQLASHGKKATKHGRFVSQDPIGIAGGMNLYAFAGNDPINGKDPFGTCQYIDVDAKQLLNADSGAYVTAHNGVAWFCTGPNPDDPWAQEMDPVNVTPYNDNGDSQSGSNSAQVFSNIGHLLEPFNNAMTKGLSGVVVMMLISPVGEGGAAVGAARTEASNLAEQLALQEAETGAGKRIMQGLIKDPAYPENMWGKMEHVHTALDGTNTVIHYWENIVTGIRSGFKCKSPL